MASSRSVAIIRAALHNIAVVLLSIQFYVDRGHKPALLLFLSTSARMSLCRRFFGGRSLPLKCFISHL